MERNEENNDTIVISAEEIAPVVFMSENFTKCTKKLSEIFGEYNYKAQWGLGNIAMLRLYEFIQNEFTLAKEVQDAKNE